MPPTTERIGETGMIRRWSGVVTAVDQLTSVEDFADRSFAAEIEYLIVDFSRTESYELSNSEIRLVAERSRVLRPDLRVAIIAPSDVMFGLARMFETTSELAGNRPYVPHVVRSSAAAIEWLQRELPDLDFSEARSRLG